MKDNVEIILNGKDWQRSLSFKGEVIHIQCDQTKDGRGRKYKKVQMFIKDVSGFDTFDSGKVQEQHHKAERKSGDA